jgi:CRP-like cAMP-binding protein
MRAKDVAGKSARSLDGFALFQGLDAQELAALAAHCRWTVCERGDRLIERGSLTRDVLFVARGAVDIVGTLESGRDIVHATVLAGELLDELTAIDGKASSTAAVAAERSVIAAMPAGIFIDLLQRRGDVSLRLLRRLALLVRTGDVRILEPAGLVASQRICAVLLRQARPDPGGVFWLVQPLPRLPVLAESAGTTPETVASTLARLYKAGVASREHNRLWLVDRAWMERHARAADD